MDEELADDELTEAELDGRRLRQVREALRRIDDGTYGRCIIDGEPIDEKRLQSVPWTPYCRKHQPIPSDPLAMSPGRKYDAR